MLVNLNHPAIGPKKQVSKGQRCHKSQMSGSPTNQGLCTPQSQSHPLLLNSLFHTLPSPLPPILSSSAEIPCFWEMWKALCSSWGSASCTRIKPTATVAPYGHSIELLTLAWIASLASIRSKRASWRWAQTASLISPEVGLVLPCPEEKRSSSSEDFSGNLWVTKDPLVTARLLIKVWCQ